MFQEVGIFSRENEQFVIFFDKIVKAKGVSENAYNWWPKNDEKPAKFEKSVKLMEENGQMGRRDTPVKSTEYRRESDEKWG